MSEHLPTRTGGCACGAVRFTTHGEPERVGLCHCMTCRRAHAATNNPFVVYRTEKVEIDGALQGWESSPGYVRWFCPTCGSRLFGGDIQAGEYELSIGSFDHPGEFAPQYESWIIRREPWLAPIDGPQFEQNRTT
jgi:hypothetical protein